MIVSRKSAIVGEMIDPTTAIIGETYFYPLPKGKAIRVKVLDKEHSNILKRTHLFFEDDYGQSYRNIIADTLKYPRENRVLYEDKEKLILSGNINGLRNRNLLRNFTRKRGFPNARRNIMNAFAAGSNASFKRRRNLLNVHNRNMNNLNQ